jgi:hypothetical protein
MKIRPMGTELFDADGKAAVKKLIATFGHFLNAPKNLFSLHISTSKLV